MHEGTKLPSVVKITPIEYLHNRIIPLENPVKNIAINVSEKYLSIIFSDFLHPH